MNFLYLSRCRSHAKCQQHRHDQNKQDIDIFIFSCLSNRIGSQVANPKSDPTTEHHNVYSQTAPKERLDREGALRRGLTTDQNSLVPKCAQSDPGKQRLQLLKPKKAGHIDQRYQAKSYQDLR